MTVFKQLLNDYKQCLLRGDHSDGAAAYLAIVAEHEKSLRVPAEPFPQGWKLVPETPTDAMSTAAIKAAMRYPAHQRPVNGQDVWFAMLDAAPQPSEETK